MSVSTSTLSSRDAVEAHYKWNEESVYPSREAWSEEAQALMQVLPTMSRFQGQLTSPAALLEWLETLDELSRRVGTLGFYAVMSQSVDSQDTQAVSMVGQASSLNGVAAASAAFAEPEILAIGQSTLHDWMQQEPRLQAYAHYFDNLFRKQQHIRSAEVEEVLGLSADPLYMIEQIGETLTNNDLKFMPAAAADGIALDVAQSTVTSLMDSPDREVRRTAWENYADGYLSVKNTVAAAITGSFKRDIFYARARRYENSLEAALFEHNLPTEVFYNLIETFKKNLPTWHRYWAAKRRALAVEKLHPYDVWAPIAQGSHKLDFEQSIEDISTALQPLGDQYVQVLRQGTLQDRWIDVYPNTGKRQGAFSYGNFGTHPFIMMSFNGSLSSTSIMAHELGHSMHSYFTWQNQPYVYSGYSLFIAEVASNFNQAMLRDYWLKNNQDVDFQFALIDETMYNFHRYFFTMPTLARFELEIHQRLERGEGVTADDMIALMAQLFSEGYGDAVHVDTERVGITWAQYGHLFTPYYVFQYATGISAANALAKRILGGEPGTAENYVRFLSSGSSVYPLDALKIAGVDMTTPEVVETAFEVLAGYVERLEKLLDEAGR